MKKLIVGLDLGVNSIGWAVVGDDDSNKEILGMGSRIIPLSPDDNNEFVTGNAISKNAKRTEKRTQRKGYDRYQQRRRKLLAFLERHGMMVENELMCLPPLELWALRNKGITEALSCRELGRVLYHLNQRRGYRSSRSEESSDDKKSTAYVEEVKGRYEELKAKGITIGQHFYQKLQTAHNRNEPYRIKQQVFPRQAYIDEFNTIISQQKIHHASLTADEVAFLRDEIIYMQRPLKSQKGLVSICEFEGQYRKNAKEADIFVGPKVAPRSSPLAQVCKIWESINNITFTNKRREPYPINTDQKLRLFDALNKTERLSQKDIFFILGIKPGDGYTGNKQTAKGIQGNLTNAAITSIIPERKDLLNFELKIEVNEEDAHLVNRSNGEIISTVQKKTVNADYERSPFFRLWHVIYSISDIDKCIETLMEKFGVTKEQAVALSRLDFRKAGFANKSARAMRKILPYLMDGYIFSDAMSLAGYNHSASLTHEENLKRQLKGSLPLLKKNSLRQPVVEKILNQMIGVMNVIIKEWGRPDEIRIELARELKQSAEERNKTFAALSKREREGEIITKRIETEFRQFGIRATRNNILKWRLFHEISNDEARLNATCVYCGHPFGITDALRGSSVDIEHIIPKSKLFDDSQGNKTLVHRRCNEDKGDRTAFDFMSAKGESVLASYIETVDRLYQSNVISRHKRDRLLTTGDDIPKDFIERQLRETQYIARKAKEILEQICYNVWSTSGQITEYLRRIWGWNEVLMNLQLPVYRDLGLTEWKEYADRDGNLHRQEVIKDWSKRNDHRHHAIDALTIACTRQGFIQRINRLNATSNRDEMRASLNGNYDPKKNLLENYIFALKPFNTKQVEVAAAQILVSFKPGKRVATLSKFKAKGKNAETGVIVPRGPLSEESVYGRVKLMDAKKQSVKYLFEHPELIFKPYIRVLVEERLASYSQDVKKALASLKKDPIYLDDAKRTILEWGSCYKEEVVIKYPLTDIKSKDTQFIIDGHIRAIVNERLSQYKGNEKKAFEHPLYSDAACRQEIRSVRCLTGLNAVVPVRKDESGREIGFVKPGNNHHIALYTDAEGQKREHLCTFWHAVERKKWGMPAVITQPGVIWDNVLQRQDNFPQEFLEKLPLENWTFDKSLQQNEMFIVGLTIEEVQTCIDSVDYAKLSKHLYRIQKLSSTGYKIVLRHHLATTIEHTRDMIGIASPSSFTGIKVYVSKTGKISIPHD